MVNVAFRVDGGPDIGMGHIMRCIALGQVFPKEVDVSFITKKTDSVNKVLRDYDFNTIFIDNIFDYGKKEIKRIKEIIDEKEINILITDSYNIDQNYLIEIKKEVDKLVSIHDFAPFAFPSDIVINGNIYAPELNYESYYGDTKFLLGTDYTLLREEFQDLPEKDIKKEVDNILVTVGGSDLLNLTPKILKSFQLLEDEIDEIENVNKNKLTINVVIGSGFDNVDEVIKEVQKSNLEISLNFNVKKMSKLMLDSDMAVSAGGSTLYELAITGTPTVALLQADNQKLVANSMEEKGFIKNLGFYKESKKIYLEIKKFIREEKERFKIYDRCKKTFGHDFKQITNEVIY